MISECLTQAIMQEALRRTTSHKAAGPDGVLGLILKHMPPTFHEALHILFQSMAITWITPPSWRKSKTILSYEKGSPPRLDNYHLIMLVNAFHKPRTTCIVTLATDSIEARKILISEYEGFRPDPKTLNPKPFMFTGDHPPKPMCGGCSLPQEGHCPLLP